MTRSAVPLPASRFADGLKLKNPLWAGFYHLHLSAQVQTVIAVVSVRVSIISV